MFTAASLSNSLANGSKNILIHILSVIERTFRSGWVEKNAITTDELDRWGSCLPGAGKLQD